MTSLTEKVPVTVIVVAISTIGTIIGTILGGYLAYRGQIEPILIPIRLTQTSEAKYPAVVPIPTIIKETVIVTSISISIVTRIVTPTYTETPIQLPFCLDGNLPCIHTAPYNQYWYDIAKINYGNGCRWPEIANSNRLPNGVYSKITANKKVYIPDPLRINVPSIVDDLGSITAIHSCKLDPKTGRLISTLPCAFEIPSNYPEGDEGYVQLSKLFYNSENYYYYLEVNNLFSGCSLFGIKGQNEPPITLFKAAIVVIPSLF